MAQGQDLQSIAQYGEYELIWKMMTGYVPVVAGIIGMFMVMIIPVIISKRKPDGNKTPVEPDLKTQTDEPARDAELEKD